MQYRIHGWIQIFLPLLLFYSLATPAFADELTDMEVHGFLSQGAVKTTDNNYLVESSNQGSFDFTEAGLNFTKQLQDNLRTGLQLFAQNFGPTDNFNIKLDWFYLDYRWTDQLGFRFGRVKIPFGLYNDISDIDQARAPVLLPQSIYPVQNRDYLLAQNGMEVYGYAQIGKAGALDYRFYAGTISVDLPDSPGSSVQVQSINVPYVVGGRVLWETPVEGLRVGGTVQDLRLDTTFVLGGQSITDNIPALLWVGSVEYAKGDLLLASEYSRWNVQSGDSSNPTLFPSESVTSERAYIMSAYRINNWLQPALYYSVLYPDVDLRSGQENQQDDISATLRFDINRFWLVKLEGHYMLGTAGLDSSLNNNIPLGQLANKWSAFFIKTTAYF